MVKINRRQFLYCSAAIASTVLPLRAFRAIGPQTCIAIGSKDIRGKIFKGDAPRRDLAIKNCQEIKSFAAFVQTAACCPLATEVSAAQRLI